MRRAAGDRLFEFGGGGVEDVGAASSDEHMGAVLEQPFGRGEAEPSSPSGHDGALTAYQPGHGALPYLSEVR
jgi:hypothetical protein